MPKGTGVMQSELRGELGEEADANAETERGALAAALAAASHENDSIAHAKGHWVRAGGGTPEEDAWPSLRALEEDVSDRREMVPAINAAAAAAALKASNDVPVE